MSSATAWTVIVGMGVVNLVLRAAPIAIVSRLHLPASVERFLSWVPVAVMATLVSVAVLRPSGAWPLPWQNPYLIAAVPTALTYRFTRSFIGTTLAGIAIFVAARWLLGLA